MMKYHKHELKKVVDVEVDGGSYYDIYKDGKKVTCAWTLGNAKEFVDTFDGNTYNWNLLC